MPDIKFLSYSIRHKDSFRTIKGYTLFGIEYKISQFADDTSLFLDGSQSSFEYCVHTILEYAKFSGLAMNFDKTKVVWFGCKDPPNRKYLEQFNFEWNPKTFTLLGVEFTTDLKNIADKNILRKLNEMKTELNQWSKRDITPFGKVTVIKTLIISKIVHLLICLPTPSLKVIKELNNIFFKFLWNDKPDKIKRTISTLNLLEGGLNMIDIDKFNQALKLTWIRRYFNTSSTWKQLTDSHLPKLAEVINFSDKFTENIMKTTKNPFWKEVLTYLTIFIKKYKITSKTEAKNTSFLYNSKVKIGNQEINDRKLINNHIFFIHQLMTEDRFLSYEEFKEKYNINFNLFRYMSIVSSVKSFLNRYNFQVKRKQCENQTPFNIILKSKKGAALIYKHM